MWLSSACVHSDEPIVGFEPTTPSLPWKCSTPELYRRMGHTPAGHADRMGKSGRPGSNRQHSAWKADTLPIELRPLWDGRCGGSRIRTYEGVSQQIYSLPQLATLVSPRPVRKRKNEPSQVPSQWPDSNRRPTVYKTVALPTELHWQPFSLIKRKTTKI